MSRKPEGEQRGNRVSSLFTSAVHEGCALPNPPTREGGGSASSPQVGKPGFPTPQPPLGAPGIPVNRSGGNPGFPMCTLDAHSRGAHRRDDHGVSLGGPPPPWPSPAGGGNRTPPRREGIGETWFPRMFTSDSHAAAPHNARMKILLFLGGLRPPKPSRGGAIFTSVGGRGAALIGAGAAATEPATPLAMLPYHQQLRGVED